MATTKPSTFLRVLAADTRGTLADLGRLTERLDFDSPAIAAAMGRLAQAAEELDRAALDAAHEERRTS